MNSTFKRFAAVLLTLVMCLTVFLATGCTDGNADSSTPESTPSASSPTESTPEQTIGTEYNITYDLDGGIDGGNPAKYNNAEDLKLIVPIRPGYDFAGWTGTGLTEATNAVTIAKGTEGDLSFKANWVENGEFEFTIDKTTTDIFGQIFFGNTTAGIVINGETTFEKEPAINPSNELIAQELQQYFERNKQIVKQVRDENLEYAATNYEFLIYIGSSDCEPVQEVVSTLNPAQYGVAVNDDSLCFIAWTEDANVAAGEILYEIIEHVAGGGSISDFAGGRYVGQIEGQVGEDVPMVDDLDSGNDVGEGAFQLYDLDSSKEAYDAYLAKLEAAGYTLHTTNVMNKTHTATYYNDDTVVSVLWAGGDADGSIGVNTDRSLRVIIEPLANTALPSLEKPADADATVTVSSVTQMSPHNLCIVIQLSNGHYVIFDSGNSGTQKTLSDFLRANAPDKNNVVIEAWIFSHFHQDHIGGFVDYMGVSSLTRYITVKNVIYNFPSYRTYMTAHESSTDMNNMNMWYNKRIPAMREKGTTIIQARTGQKFYFGNAEIEILWTFEDLMPFNIFEDRTNPTSLGCTITIGGQKIMLTGDSSEEEFRVVAARYGDYLKSDFVQLAHHGGGNGAGIHNFYELVNAPVVFYPNPSKEYPTWRGENEIRAIDNAKLVIRSGNYGTATLKLPFTIGDKIVSEKVPNLNEGPAEE